MKPTSERAINLWWELACLNAKTDYLVNDLLERIAGAKYKTDEQVEDPIWITICNLTNAERRRFINGCQNIKKGGE